jgi:hypothetical protein
MIRHLVAVALVVFSAPAFAETYYLDKDAWTCEAFGAIEEVEHAAKLGSADTRLADKARCMFSGTVQGSKDGGLANAPTNIMYVTGQYVFVCSKMTSCGPGHQTPVFYCSYALASDVRDSHGAPVTPQQLQKEATGRTMADVKEYFPPQCD